MFCFLCGKLGHDDKHCLDFPDWQNTPKQYGEWLKAGGAFKRNSVGRETPTEVTVERKVKTQPRVMARQQ